MAWYRLELLHADVLRVRHPAQSSFTHQGGEREQEVTCQVVMSFGIGMVDCYEARLTLARI